jgi:beta-catenin-like protein 1
VYRRRDPEKGGEEEEYVENLFEAATCLVDEAEGKDQFLEAEGVELCLLMLKEGKMSKLPALRLLEHASTGSSALKVCCRIVEAGGLKPTFSLFAKTRDVRLSNHLVLIFASMLRLLPGESAERIRTLAKFVEKDYSKITRLVELRRYYCLRVKRVDEQNAEERELTPRDSEQGANDREIEWLSRRLDAGLITLQNIDNILAWLAVEDKGARFRIVKLLGQEDVQLSDVKATLVEQMKNLDTSQREGQDLKDMLGALVDIMP